MISTESLRVAFAIGLLAAAAACTQPMDTAGSDRRTRSEATNVTWTDGKPAIAISCDDPQECQRRAQAMCKSGYSVLKSENMPVAPGSVRYATGKSSTTIRCNG